MFLLMKLHSLFINTVFTFVFQELMRLMGMEGWALWGSWLVDALLVRLISLALVVVLLKTAFDQDSGAVLRKSEGSVLYFMLLLYTVPAVISCFAISAFFSRRKQFLF